MAPTPRWLRVLGLAGGITAGVGSLTACADGSGGAGSTGPGRTPTTTSTAPSAPTSRTTLGAGASPEAAIAAYLAATPAAPDFAGACAGTELPRDVGKWCARLTTPPDDTRRYHIGPTFSEFVEELTLERRGDVWVVTARGPIRGPRGGAATRTES